MCLSKERGIKNFISSRNILETLLSFMKLREVKVWELELAKWPAIELKHFPLTHKMIGNTNID